MTFVFLFLAVQDNDVCLFLASSVLPQFFLSMSFLHLRMCFFYIYECFSFLHLRMFFFFTSTNVFFTTSTNFFLLHLQTFFLQSQATRQTMNEKNEKLIPLGTWPPYACVYVPSTLMQRMQEMGCLDSFVRKYFGSALESTGKKGAFALSMLRTPIITLQEVFESVKHELTETEKLCVALIYVAASTPSSTYENHWKYLPALPTYDAASTTGMLTRILASATSSSCAVMLLQRQHAGWMQLKFWIDTLLPMNFVDMFLAAPSFWLFLS